MSEDEDGWPWEQEPDIPQPRPPLPQSPVWWAKPLEEPDPVLSIWFVVGQPAVKWYGVHVRWYLRNGQLTEYSWRLASSGDPQQMHPALINMWELWRDGWLDQMAAAGGAWPA